MSTLNTWLKRVGITHPIFLAPMAGGPSTPQLAAAVSNAGGLGSIGGAYLSPEKLRAEIRKTKELTSKPFSVNLFMNDIPNRPDDREFDRMNAILGVYRKELGMSGFAPISSEFESKEEQMNVVLDEKVPVFTFTFGMPPEEYIREFKKRGILTIGTATNFEEAQALQTLGVDAVCAQGSEAGGHRGTFIGKVSDSLIGTMALTGELVEQLEIPVIAAGGIMNGKGINAALALGAVGAQLGTAFLLCDEAGTNETYRNALKSSCSRYTDLTRAFSGRYARGIVNRMMTEMKNVEVLPFPYQNMLTKDLRALASTVGNPDFLSLWSGQAVGLIREMSAKALMDVLIQEMLRSSHVS